MGNKETAIDDIPLEKIEQNQVNKELETLPISRKKVVLIMIGLALSIFVGSLDNTIVSTALTVITSEFNALNQITWVAASYLLTATALQPLYGKFSDIFGRKITMLFALLIFLVGSIVCGAASNIIILIVFRAISGIGGGGLISLSTIIISDIVPIQKRGLYMGIVGATFALASVVGPLIGGAFTDGVTWRWAFYINIPICAVTIAVIILFLSIPTPKEDLRKKLNRIDYLGTFSLIVASTCLVLGLNWGGKDYRWDSAPVISTIIIGLVSFILFFWIEAKYATEPIVPFHILNRNVICASLINFFNGFTFFVSIYYIPLYYQAAKGRTATIAGLELLPLLLGVVFASIFSGIFASKTGSYRILSMIGTTMILIGVILFGALLRPDISRAEEIIFALIIGLGVGLCIQTTTVIAQAAVEEEDIAVVTALINFTQQLGAVLGLAIQGAIFSNILTTYLTEKLPGVNVAAITSSVESLGSLTKDQLVHVGYGYIQGVKYIYFSLIAFAVLAAISAFLVKHIPFRSMTIAVGH